MSRRIVALGPQVEGHVKGLVISPMDAGALVGSGQWRVSLTAYDGDLYDATVLSRVTSLPSDEDWETLKKICYSCQEIEIETPIPLATFVGG